MNFLFNNGIKSGNRMLRIRSFYNFCRSKPALGGFGLASLIGRYM